MQTYSTKKCKTYLLKINNKLLKYCINTDPKGLRHMSEMKHFALHTTAHVFL